MIQIPPVDIPPGGTLTLNPPNNHVVSVLLVNPTGYVLNISIAGNQGILAAWTSNVFPVQSGQQVLITPAGKIAGGGTDTVLYGTWLLDSDTFSGTYPTAVPPQQVQTGPVTIDGPVDVNGTVDIGGPVDINGPVTITGTISGAGGASLAVATELLWDGGPVCSSIVAQTNGGTNQFNFGTPNPAQELKAKMLSVDSTATQPVSVILLLGPLAAQVGVQFVIGPSSSYYPQPIYLGDAQLIANQVYLSLQASTTGQLVRVSLWCEALYL